ncbi:MAG: carbohydrate-binding domain-containing protein [Clostridiales bacterium]|nr:carbohydrate-binding domain-containing protein [Clostridiales bacterium]
MKTRRFCACIMALLLAVSMPLTALADDWYLDEGSISVEANESGQTVSQGETSKNDSAPVISQSRPESGSSGNSGSGSSGNTDSAPPASSESTSNTITITAGEGSTANVTLNGVNISGADGAAIQTSGGGNVTIELDGDNEVQSGYGSAGVEKNNSGSLTITDNNGNGSLKATGGEGGAGIGGGKGGNGSNITISGGTVNATGGENAAGIGGGGKSDGFDGGNGSNITISGGTVTAKGGISGAGIGGAMGGTGSNITISDGTVNANGGEGGAGIGGGASGAGSGITIKGGTVNAKGGTDAAGIGGGTHGNGSNITISGSTTTATGGDPQEISDDKAVGGGAGIGGGAYGTSDNITVKYTAQVTATGKGNAANIGNGYASEATEKQKDKVDLSGLSSFGNVNGISGGDGGYHASNGSSSSGGSSGGSFVSFFGSNSGSNSSSSSSYKSRLDVKATLGKITSTDNDGNDLSNVVWLKEDSELDITAREDKFSVTGSPSDLLKLKKEGISKINLETNRVNVSVSNQVLDKITDSGGGFQLTADGTTVSLSSTDGNNQKTPGLKLTADKQPEKGKLQVDFRSEESKEGTGDVRESLNKTLQVSTNAPEATLSLEQKYLQTLQNSEFSKLALAVGNLITTVDSMLAANTAVNGSGSISIDDESVIMNGFKFSAGDSSENDQLTDMVTNIKFKKEITPVGGSAMVVEVDAKAPMKSASLKVPGSALQSLIDQGVEETALSINGKTTSINNSNLREQIDDSKPGIPAAITVKDLNILVP